MGQCPCLEGAKKSTGTSTTGTSRGNMPARNKSGGQFVHAAVIVDSPGKIEAFYTMGKKLGEGAYGTVCLATNKATKVERAVKNISKKQMKDQEAFFREITIMKIMDHPNIIKLYETFEDSRNFSLVMEVCTGGEMFDRIIEAGKFDEKQAATIMQQIIRSIFYMHGQMTCHRDLKPENFIFQDKQAVDKSNLKLIDFGLSKQFTDGQVLTTKAGTPYYVAPQVLAGKYDKGCDVWSCGVIMYVLLCGYPPFYAENDGDVLSKVRSGNYSFPAAEWKGISEDAKTLIKDMLKMDPAARHTAEKALNTKWIKEKAPGASGVGLGANLVDNMRGFRATNRLKKAALHIIASQLDEKQIQSLRNIFMNIDANGDGKLTTAELKAGIEKAGLKEIPGELKAIMQDIDSDGSGEIDYTEFLAACLDKRDYVKEDVCRSAFRVFDKDGDGRITQDELKMVLGDDEVESMVGAATIQQLMTQVDSNGDGVIDFEEFMEMMTNSAPAEANKR